MSAPMKKHHINKAIVNIEGKLFVGPKRKLKVIEGLLAEHNFIEDKSSSISWRNAFKDEISQYGELGFALKGARLKAELTQVELCEKVGITQANYSKMENGKRAIGKDMAKRLAKVLDVDYRIFL